MKEPNFRKKIIPYVPSFPLLILSYFFTFYSVNLAHVLSGPHGASSRRPHPSNKWKQVIKSILHDGLHAELGQVTVLPAT